ncbi:MAG: ATP-binding protein [Nitrospirota bacterium]
MPEKEPVLVMKLYGPPDKLTLEYGSKGGRYLRPDLLIIDDMGLKKLPKQSRVSAEVIMRWYEQTHDYDLKPAAWGWGKLVGDVPTATTILDRF